MFGSPCDLPSSDREEETRMMFRRYNPEYEDEDYEVNEDRSEDTPYATTSQDGAATGNAFRIVPDDPSDFDDTSEYPQPQQQQQDQQQPQEQQQQQEQQQRQGKSRSTTPPTRIAPTTSIDDEDPKEALPPSSQGDDDVELVWNEDGNSNSMKRKLFAMFQRNGPQQHGNNKNHSKQSLASTATCSTYWDKQDNHKRSAVAIVDGDDGSVETQRAEQKDILIGDKRITVIGNPDTAKSENRRRSCVLCFVLFLAICGTVAAIVLGIYNRRNSKENSLRGKITNGGFLGAYSQQTDGSTSALEAQAGNGASPTILETGCFQYSGAAGEDLVCFMQDSPQDPNCAVVVNGDSTCQCSVCENGAITATCPSDGKTINEACYLNAANYQGTILQAFVSDSSSTTGNEELGQWLVEDKETVQSSIQTGCLDMNFRLHSGSVICVLDHDPTGAEMVDDFVVLINGSMCRSVTVCDSQMGTLSVDCSNLDTMNVIDGSSIINQDCADTTSSNKDILAGTFLQEFSVDSKRDVDPEDAEWVDESAAISTTSACFDHIETDFRCYDDGQDVKIFFSNCNQGPDDWIGVYGAFAPADTLSGNPVEDKWTWACLGEDGCESEGSYDGVVNFGSLPEGVYRAFMIRDHDVHPNFYQGYAWSDIFQVRDASSKCERTRRD